jgi:peptidoglycan hydrolase-like protein with peptidoglycan-binding domain
MTIMTADVGPNGAKLIQDITLIQAMLQAITRPDGRRYYNANYDGRFGPKTAAAITDFQTAHGIAGPESGHVSQGTATWQELLNALPPDKQDMRVMPGTAVVYLAASTALLSKGLAKVSGAKFQSDLATRVTSLIRDMYQAHGIALTVGGDGGFRTFKQQADLHSNVGPGESLHNYGLAADIYFNTLRLVGPEGALVSAGDESFYDLETLSYATWEARNLIAQRHGMYPIGNQDRPHLKGMSQVSPGQSLVALLNTRGKMTWDVTRGKPNMYKSNLGGSGVLIDVGQAAMIWRAQANLTPHTIATALGIQAVHAHSGDLNRFRNALLDEFRWAEQNWRNWQPK